MQNKWILIAIITLFFSPSVLAQISEGGTPPSFRHTEKASLRASIIPKELTPLRSIEELKKEDEQIPKIGYPQRIGTDIPVEIDICRDGNITELENGDKIIRYTISAPDAVGLMIYYSDFYVPQGGQLFIYSHDKKQVIGAFTYNTNPSTKEYATEAIYADEITLEYLVSKTSEETPRIIIKEVGYIYSDPNLDYDSQACMIDINCPEGANWQTQKRGVVYLITKDSKYIYRCSGALVNNMEKDKKPYILSAFHCLPETNPKYAQFLVYFNYENDTCGGERTTPPNSMAGMSLVATNPLNGGSDGLLLLLNTDIPDKWKPYYNGWDVTSSTPKSGVIIHHPNGDAKKITTYSTSPSISRWRDKDGNISTINSMWLVRYSSSVTEGGSSGSPIFNENGLIVGTLTGGNSICSDPLNPDNPDYYGRLYFHWNKASTVENYFKTYLDPKNTGLLTLAGMNFDGTSIEEEMKTEIPKSMVVFPSPVLDELNVNCNEIIREISIVDVKGRAIFNLNDHDSSTLIVPTSTWASGVYSVIVKTSEGNHITEKVIKQ